MEQERREDWTRALEERRRRHAYEAAVRRLGLVALALSRWPANENEMIPF